MVIGVVTQCSLVELFSELAFKLAFLTSSVSCFLDFCNVFLRYLVKLYLIVESKRKSAPLGILTENFALDLLLMAVQTVQVSVLLLFHSVELAMRGSLCVW
jgi:hypothetical protein